MGSNRAVPDMALVSKARHARVDTGLGMARWYSLRGTCRSGFFLLSLKIKILISLVRSNK